MSGGPRADQLAEGGVDLRVRRQLKEEPFLERGHDGRDGRVLEARELGLSAHDLDHRDNGLLVRVARLHRGDASTAELLVDGRADAVEYLDILLGQLERGALDQPSDALAGRVAEAKPKSMWKKWPSSSSIRLPLCRSRSLSSHMATL